MTDIVDLGALLDKERRRAAKPKETREQRARRRLTGRFHGTLSDVWSHAHLLSDDELVWLSTVTEAAKTKGTRTYRRWSGGTAQVVRATNYDDALRLDRMRAGLWDRRWERDRQQRAADRRKVTLALRRLGLPVPECRRRRWGAMSEPLRVFNKRRGPVPPGAIYIGRPTKWGNPYIIGRDGDRAAVIAKYRVWICDQPALIAALPELRGRNLVCFCDPEPCHGDVLLELANAAIGVAQ